MPALLRRPALGLALLAAAPAAAAPRVAVDIAPIHSIVSAVMAGVASPELVLPPGASPHGHALRPSEAAGIAEADLVVWVGPALTPWLEKPLLSLGGDRPRLTLMEAPGVALLPVRAAASFEPHEHPHEQDDHAAEHAEDGDPAQEHDEAAAVDAAADAAVDAHIWLDPQNAAAIAAAVAAELSAIDPDHAPSYAANARAFSTGLVGLKTEIAATLAPVHDRGFLVFHDAYQYFERAFDIPAAGSIVLTDGAPPSPGRVAELRERILDSRIVCVLAEPQFEPKLIATLVEGAPVRTGTLDPLGTGIALGADLYPALMRNLAVALSGCLTG